MSCNYIRRAITAGASSLLRALVSKPDHFGDFISSMGSGSICAWVRGTHAEFLCRASLGHQCPLLQAAKSGDLGVPGG